MEERKAFYRLLAGIGCGMLLTALLIYCIDPFYHYHEAWFGLPVVMEEPVYQTPGAARNMPYDSVILGTSMTENFHSSWFSQEMGWNTLKLSYSGARTNDLHAVLGQIYTRSEGPENVVMDINAYQLTEPYWTSYSERPEYLYDNNPLTDVCYLYNYDVLMESLERVLDKLQGVEYDLDNAYTWEDESYFGKQQALDSALDIRKQLREADTVLPQWNERLENCEANIRNVTAYIKEHPDTQFYIFYPPYSMLYWEQEVLKGELEQIIAIYEYSIRQLLEYDNVQVYYFQDEEDIISNLDNYRDVSHYRPEINRYIFECIRDGKNLLTQDNYKEHLHHMYEYAEEFPYDILWK